MARPISPSAAAGERFTIRSPGHPHDGLTVTLVSCTGRTGGIGGGGAWVVELPDGSEGVISIYTPAIPA